MLSQDQVVLGRRNAAPTAINWSELDGIKRGREESPTDSLNKSKEAAWRFAALDPGTEEGKSPSAALFAGQIAGDIRSALQKPSGADARVWEGCWMRLGQSSGTGIGWRRKAMPERWLRREEAGVLQEDLGVDSEVVIEEEDVVEGSGSPW